MVIGDTPLHLIIQTLFLGLDQIDSQIPPIPVPLSTTEWWLQAQLLIPELQNSKTDEHLTHFNFLDTHNYDCEAPPVSNILRNIAMFLITLTFTPP